MFRSYGSLIGFLALTIAVGIGCADDEGTGGTGGTGGGGGGGQGGASGETKTEVIDLGCTNNITADVSLLGWSLTVATEAPIVANEAFTVTLGGLADFPEAFLDAAQTVVPGGLRSAGLQALAVTVAARSGAAGDPVTLGGSELPYTCTIPVDDQPVSCDPANDVPDGNGANTDCVPVLSQNRCLQFVDVPVSEDEQVCADLGKTEQFELNGFCVTGALELELETTTATFTATDAAEVLFGWDDENTGATVRDDGAYDLPRPAFGDPPEPNGIRVIAGALLVGVQCTMAVDSAGPNGVAVCDGGDNNGQPCLAPADGDNDSCFGGANDGDSCESNTDCPGGTCANRDCGPASACEPDGDASPTPDDLLISFTIEGGGAGGEGGAGGTGGAGGAGAMAF